jgi:hypothetical protein
LYSFESFYKIEQHVFLIKLKTYLLSVYDKFHMISYYLIKDALIRIQAFLWWWKKTNFYTGKWRNFTRKFVQSAKTS